MPTKANCEPPVNITSESTCACQMSSPAATARAPKLTPYVPLATPTDHAWRTTSRRRVGDSGASTLTAPRRARRLVGSTGTGVEQARRQAHLPQDVAVGGDDPVAVGPVGPEPRAGGEGARGLVVGEQPHGDGLGPGLAQQVDPGVEQP